MQSVNCLNNNSGSSLGHPGGLSEITHIEVQGKYVQIYRYTKNLSATKHERTEMRDLRTGSNR